MVLGSSLIHTQYSLKYQAIQVNVTNLSAEHSLPLVISKVTFCLGLKIMGWKKIVMGRKYHLNLDVTSTLAQLMNKKAEKEGCIIGCVNKVSL